jgi:predicted ester cyclase
MNRTVSFVCATGVCAMGVCAASVFPLFLFWGAAHAQTALTAEEARAVVAPLYDALNQPANKDVAMLLEKAASPNWQSCGANDQCAPRERVIAGIKSRGETIPDLKWEIKELIVAGNEVIVRGEASGTLVAPLYGVEPTGKGFKIMSIDIHTIEGGTITRSYHIEDWAGAMRQVASK